MLGRLPWFAFERRRRALRFLVFFDMRFHSSRCIVKRGAKVIDHTWRRHLARLPEYGVPLTSVFEQT